MGVETKPGSLGYDGMTLSFALCEVKRLKEMISFVSRIIGSAQTNRSRYEWNSERTKDSVIAVVYPGINVNELRKWRREMQDALEELQSRIKVANWESGTQAQLERLEKINRQIKRASEDIANNTRLYPDEVENAPQVLELMDEVQALYAEQSALSYGIQKANMEKLVSAPKE